VTRLQAHPSRQDITSERDERIREEWLRGDEVGGKGREIIESD
jgi:hypothetical protein